MSPTEDPPAGQLRPSTGSADTSSTNHRRPAYDGLLVVSFGGPEGPDEVMGFLENVTRGRGVPRERLEEVAEQYATVGGVSPLPAHNRAFVEAVRADLARAGLDWPVVLGNRNWRPYLAEALTELADAGCERVLAFVTSAYSSYSGCRQYREDIEAARFAVGPGCPEVHVLRRFHNHPGFIGPFVEHTRAALERWPAEQIQQVRLVGSAHSIPMSMARACDYQAQLTDACALVAAGVGHPSMDLVWQSRSGPPQIPWLEPDVSDHLRALADEGVSDVCLVPIGFVADHQEVVYDLDTLAAQTAAEVGIRLERAASPGLHPDFVAMVTELVEERLWGTPARSLGPLAPRQDVCAVGCCPPPARRPGG